MFAVAGFALPSFESSAKGARHARIGCRLSGIAADARLSAPSRAVAAIIEGAG